MKFNKMHDLPKSLHKLVEKNVYFRLDKEGDVYVIKPLEDHEAKEAVDSLLQFANELHDQLEIQDLVHTDQKSLDTIINFRDVLREFGLKNQKRQEIAEQLEKLRKVEFAISLGGKIPVEDLKEDQRQFLLANQFHEKVLPMRIPLKYKWDEGIMLPFEIEATLYHHVPWEKLTREKLFDKKQREIGYRFLLKENQLFATHWDYTLTKRYTLLCEGITQYHYRKSNTVYPTFKVNPHKTKQKNELIFEIREKEITVLLKRDDGVQFSLGMEKNRIVSPVKDFYQPPRRSIKVGCRRQDIDKIKKLIEVEKFWVRKDIRHKNLFFILEEVLDIKPIPRKALISSNHFLSYLTLPLALLEYRFAKSNDSLPGIRDFIKAPYGKYCVDYKALKKQLLEEAK